MATEAAAPDDGGALLRLLSWLSPSYPVGAYTYSHGLEQALEAGDCERTPAGVGAWVDGVLRFGGARSDAVLLAHAWRAEDTAALHEVAALARALTPSAERRLETGAQGRAFLDATRSAWPAPALARADGLETTIPYPVAVGLAASAHGVPLAATLRGYLHAFVANLVSAAVRLVPLGQTDGQRLVAASGVAVEAVAAEAADAPLDEVGGIALLADVASMNHEIQYTRLFRS